MDVVSQYHSCITKSEQHGASFVERYSGTVMTYEAEVVQELRDNEACPLMHQLWQKEISARNP